MDLQQNKKQREAELVATVQAYRLDLGLQSLKKLLELRLQHQDQRLRQCLPDEFMAEQAKAKVYEMLIKELNT